MEASYEVGNRGVVLSLDDLVKENFELFDPGRSKSKLHKPINPECDWT